MREIVKGLSLAGIFTVLVVAGINGWDPSRPTSIFDNRGPVEKITDGCAKEFAHDKAREIDCAMKLLGRHYAEQDRGKLERIYQGSR